jgi:hypothetical protein
MTMQKPSTGTRTGSTSRAVAPRPLLATAIAAALLISTIFCPPATARTRVSASVYVPGIQIACFHRMVHRFTAQTKPARCEIAGHEGEERRFVRLRVVAY